jgi:outer membrane protein assembly factor BamB/subtilase family serine protease
MMYLSIALVGAQPAPFLISGLAVYDNAMPCNNLTLNITNLNTSTGWQAETHTGYNFYQLVLDKSEVHCGDVLQFNAMNRDANTANISQNKLDRMNEGFSILEYNITFTSKDVIVMINDTNGTIHLQRLSLITATDCAILNATKLACDRLDIPFESNETAATRIDGIDDPVVHRYNKSRGEWIEIPQCHCLADGDLICWTDADTRPPAMLPDLWIADMQIENCWGHAAHSNIKNAVAATVANNGCSTSGWFDLTLSVDGELIDVKSLPPLDPMEDATIVFDWVPEEAGNCTVLVEVDSNDLIAELNDDNNKVSRDVTVKEGATIRVPHDYLTIQDAVDNATAYSSICIDEGGYGGFTIKNNHHLNIIGAGEDATKCSGTHILSSSNIKLSRFHAQSGIHVYDSDNISLTNLVMTHSSYREDRYLLKIDDSIDCMVSDNFMSGSLSPAGWAVRMATSGVLIASDNNTICNNVISNCQYTVKLEGDNNTIYANSLFFTEAGDSMENAFAIDIGQNNHWNASSPLSYTFNNITTVNYIGNYWDEYMDEDHGGDGIWDTPYNISDTARDYHPLVVPYNEEYDLDVRLISLPHQIYAGVDNTIIVALSQNSQRVAEVTVDLSIDGDVIESRHIELARTAEKTLEYVSNPDETGTHEISVDASIDDSVTSFRTGRSVLADIYELPYNYSGSIGCALQFLRDEQTPASGSIGAFSTSAWAVLAISAAGEDPDEWMPYDRSLVDYLETYPSLPENEFVLDYFEDLARTCLAISALGDVDPMNFGGVNYLTTVKSYHDGVQFDDPASINDDALGILALVSAGDPNSTGIIDRSVEYIISRQNRDGGWSKIIEGTGGNVTANATSDVKTTSLAIQALVAAGEHPKSSVITNASAFLRRSLDADGSFSDAVTTASAVQAILAMGENPLVWWNTSVNNSDTPIEYLLNLQQPDGSFNYTTNRSLFPRDTTAKVIPALTACPHPPRITDIDAYPLPEITQSGYLDLPEIVYVNTSSTVHGRLRCDGGIIDVSLLEDGVPASTTQVRSIWRDSVIPFSLEWTPVSDGFVNLTVFVDSSNRIREVYEENNNMTGRVFVSLPDLAIPNVALPDRIVVDARNIINITVCGTTDEHFNVTFLSDGREAGRRRIDGIKDATNLSFEWRPNTTGVHSITFITDSDGEVREGCETDNAATVDAEVVFTDLAPVSLTPGVAFVRAKNNITVTINGTAEEFNVSLVENGSVVANVTNITCYGWKSVNLTYTPQSPGDHTVTVVIDPNDDILETNETNNNLTTIINVVLTDLVPIMVVQKIAYLNVTNRMVVSVNGTAEGFNATLIAYARDASNSTIIVNEAGNMTNATNITDPMIVNATDLDTYDNGNLTIWWTPHRKGWHNLTVIVDPDNDVIETNESNNNLTAEVFVANKIDLELVSPRGGEVWNGTQAVRWTALHDENLTIDLFYSPNYGINWIPLASNLTCDLSLTANLTENLTQNETNETNSTYRVNYNGVYLWDTTNLSDGEYLIRITAQWYLLEEVYTSNTVIVLNGDAASGGIGGNARYFDWDTPDEPHLAWVSEDIFAGSSTSIVVADDKVFVYCTGGDSRYTYMIALNATNGEMLWATEIDAAQYDSWASPAYHNESIFIASGAHVYRIDGDTGDILWDYTFSDCGANCNGGPSVSGGKVFVATFATDMDAGAGCQETPGNMFCLDEETGKELWNTSSYLESTLHLGSPTPKYGRIYYGRGDDVYCLTTDGVVVWNTSTGYAYSTPIVVDGVVYSSTYAGDLYALYAFNGSIIWHAFIEPTDTTPAYFAPRDSDTKYVYAVGGCAGVFPFGVYCFNAKNGSLIWSGGDVGSWTNSVAVSRDAKVFAGVAGGSFGYNGLKCLDAYNGTELWSSPYGGSSPYIAYGRVYTIGGDRLYAFGKRELPDLVVTAASASGGVVHATIKNIGTGGTNEGFRVALRQSGSVIDECTVDALDAGESVAVTLGLHGACGDMEVYADSGGDVPERNEYNNMRGLQVPCDSGYMPVVPEPEPEHEPEPEPEPIPPEPDPHQQVHLPGWGDGGGYLGLYSGFGDGTDDSKTTAESGVEAVVNKTESAGSEQTAKGYPMGTKFKTGGAGGGYFSYITILAALILLGLLVHGIRKERGRYRRSMK